MTNKKQTKWSRQNLSNLLENMGGEDVTLMHYAFGLNLPASLSDNLISGRVQHGLNEIEDELCKENYDLSKAIPAILSIEDIVGHDIIKTLSDIKKYKEFYKQPVNFLTMNFAKVMQDIAEDLYGMLGEKYRVVGLLQGVTKSEIREIEKAESSLRARVERAYNNVYHSKDIYQIRLDVRVALGFDYRLIVAKCQKLIGDYQGRIQVDFADTRERIKKFLLPNSSK